MRDEFAACMGSVARELLGVPNSRLSTPEELRYGLHGSLSVDLIKGVFCNHETGVGGGVIDLVVSHLGGTRHEAVEWLRDKGHIKRSQSKGISAKYDYADANGRLIFQVVRYDPKAFRQRHPDPGDPKKWVWDMDGVDKVIYRLPEVLEAIRKGETIYIAEGEKAVEALRGLGMTATCSPGGAGKWKPAYNAWFVGAAVVVLPDNDEPGQVHAAAVAESLTGAGAQPVRVINLPGLAPKGDAADWIANGGSMAELQLLVEATPIAACGGGAAPTTGGFDLTEDGVALAFTSAFRDQLLYCHTTGAWFEWTEKVWRRDERKRAFSWSRKVCREIARGAGAKGAELAKLAKAAFAAAVERYAQADEAFAVTASTWDADPWLMGTPSGTLDLRTGQLREANPADRIAKLTAVAPATTADCPLWIKFLEDATGNDKALIRFLQQWCGYVLTGSTREHALLFIYGGGGNGKTVFINVITGIMAQYAKTAPMDTFTASQSDRHPTDMAGLKGARLVAASETEEGRAWAEAKIKALTGGDRISARFMRQDFFEFTPEFKLTIVGNHKPILRNLDDASKRRLNMVPFVRKPESPDRELEAKLRAEWPGIFRWAIDGCIDWQRNGLIRPAAVVDATADYFASQDTFGSWLAERCIADKSLTEKPSRLLADFNEWAGENGEQHANRKGFRSWAERQPNVRYKVVKGVDLIEGIGLRPTNSVRQGGEGGDGWS